MFDYYAVRLITDDVADAVASAGGWLVDRVRAGWRVTALVADGADPVPLRILGATVVMAGEESESAYPSTVALSVDLLGRHGPLERAARTLLRNPSVEATVWGEGVLGASRRFQEAQHRPSASARAFKARALLAAGRQPEPEAVERFRACAPFYPLDRGADLEHVPTRSAAR